MKVSLVSDWWPPRVGGIESQLPDLARELARRGHAVRVLTTTRQPDSIDGVSVEHVATPMLGSIAVPDLRRVPELADLLARGTPDVVHAHGMFSPLAIGSVLAAARLGAASVATVHSLLAPAPVFAAAAAIFRVFTNRATILTGVSGAVAQDIERASGRAAVVIPNGLDIDRYRATNSQPPTPNPQPPIPNPQPPLTVLSVLRLVPKKRPGDLIAAFDEACRRMPSMDVTLTIVGDGPLRPRLEQDAARRGLSDRVVFAGRCSRERIRSLLADASFVAHPGQLEAFGLAVLEARAADLPVVAMRAGGMPELVEHGRTGLLAGSVSEFASHLATLASDADMRARMSQATAAGLERFRWDAVASAYEDVYARARAATGAATAPAAME